MEPMIPADDPVRLLSAFVEEMDLSELYDTYDRVRKNQATPRSIFLLILNKYRSRSVLHFAYSTSSFKRS